LEVFDVKAIRQRRILEIIETKPIETQEELAEELRQQGLEVTQATVSRDIKELRLLKNLTGEGKYRYALPRDEYRQSGDRMARIFQDSVVHMDFSENIIVIRTLPGMAQAVAFTIDNAQWEEIIGTVAGDDAILIVIKPIERVQETLDKFIRLLD
jgi:transcriptional regulator of arginine metabolism